MSGKIQARDFREALRKERPLHTRGSIQVSLHALVRTGEVVVLPLDLLEGFPQLLRHAVECCGEVTHEVDVLVQVAPSDLLGLPGQVARGSRGGS